jgi:hypothetical protein
MVSRFSRSLLGRRLGSVLLVDGMTFDALTVVLELYEEDQFDVVYELIVKAILTHVVTLNRR